MGKLVIVVDDTTSHGGKVLTGNPSFEISDKPAACVGDKVHCPLHGDTTITEGYQTITLQPSRFLAYDGCKTSCGATLIGGKQTICYIGFDDEPVHPHTGFNEVKTSPHKNPDQLKTEAHPPHQTKAKSADPIQDQHGSTPQQKTEKNTVYPNDDEFKLFVATVWGEACNQSVNGWKGVASVIMNRVKWHRWNPHNQSVTSIIYNTGFDAVHSQQNKQFKKAKKYLFHDDPSSLDPYETKRMRKLIEEIRPIYYHKKVITNANYYYSPKAQLQAYLEEKKKQQQPNQLKDVGKHPLVPSFLKDKSIKPVDVLLASTDDLKFYFGL